MRVQILPTSYVSDEPLVHLVDRADDLTSRGKD